MIHCYSFAILLIFCAPRLNHRNFCYICTMKQLKSIFCNSHPLGHVVWSAVLFAAGWAISGGGALVLVALMPLLILSSKYSGSARDTMKFAGWAALTFVLWNLATVWWVWNAAPIGTIAATIVSSWWNLVPITLYHIVSKRMSKAVSYILLITAWIGCEYIYIQAPAMSFPWLVLGNAFAYTPWAVQWYEYTGVLGGTLWALVVNITAFEFRTYRTSGKCAALTVAFVLPVTLSLVLYFANSPNSEKYSLREDVTVSAIQPNVDCYRKFDGSNEAQQQNLMNLLREVPDSAQFVLMPETSLAARVNERFIAATRIVQSIITHLKLNRSEAMVIAGVESIVPYGNHRKSDTNRRTRDGVYFDIFNSSIGMTDDMTNIPIHHKGKLVIGVETLPAWFRTGGIFEVDLGGTAGQLGIGTTAKPFTHNNIKIAPAICYEGLYGNFMGEYVRNGAQILSVVSNDGWWGNTPGHRYLFAYCRLRAIEHRRDIARSANTGVSGFINSRGDVLQSLGWEEKGVITQTLKANDSLTFYSRHGDYLGRISLYIALLCLLYTVAVQSKKRFYLD